MGADDAGVLEAARAIRPFLSELVDMAAADRLDRQIADLLTEAPEGPATAERLRALLEEQQDTTGWFLSEVLADAPHYRPPSQQPRHRRRRIPYPPGDPSPISAPRYTCPERGDYVWYRPDVDTPIPECPTHHLRLTQT